ncbi:hypothetical protein AQUCO_08500019v1 [Aquilegia coerulea]|uniref:DUF7876 domain-containing protein n=1 Tax=Aquilegia coerulea TaxID=218851 RepID=A0A2G5C6L5_AQUCA|nr:hypothetical protein AQUCO_08500019v1 [Aquilegia coerulea]
MLTVRPPKAIYQNQGQTPIQQQMPLSSITQTNLLTQIVVSDAFVRNHRIKRLRTSSCSLKCINVNTSNLSRIPDRISLKRWLCRSRTRDSLDDEFRSSRNIAISLFRRYRNVIDRGGGDNLKEFISAGVNAYALGCTDEGLRKELIDVKDSGVDIEGTETYGGKTSLQSKILAKEV